MDVTSAAPSAWQVIESSVSASEAEELKIVLGASLVDQVIDLREEVSNTMCAGSYGLKHTLDHSN